jgi:energy-coupling factor transporter ATP-binding protein EcfA2
LVNGRDIRNVAVSDLALEVGFVLQNPDRQLFAATVEEEVSFGPKNMELSQAQIKERVDYALDAVGLNSFRDAFPPALSKGDRAKVVIASVLAMGPEIIILDEPTSGQDYRGCYQIMDIAQEFNKRGHTLIVVTHHMALVAEYTARTIVMMNSGHYIISLNKSI